MSEEKEEQAEKSDLTVVYLCGYYDGKKSRDDFKADMKAAFQAGKENCDSHTRFTPIDFEEWFASYKEGRKIEEHGLKL